MDVSYGGENGFNQAIELSAESLANVKFIQEKKLIGKYFDEISQVRIELDIFCLSNRVSVCMHILKISFTALTIVLFTGKVLGDL